MLSTVTAVLALAAAVQAAPAPAKAAAKVPRASGSGTARLPAVHQDSYVRNGTAALIKAYKKYGFESVKPLSNEIMAEIKGTASKKSKRQDSSADADPDSSDVEYLVDVSVGGQTLSLDFDTGSADLWVFSSLLSSSDRSGHSYYTSSDSDTWEKISGCTWDISYADGSGASGSCGYDTVIIGETTVEDQVIELASTVSSAFVSDASDGLVGLAFSSINTVSGASATTFFNGAKSSLDSKLFAAYLPFQADGEYNFGFTDSSHYTGSIVYADVDDSNGFWEFDSVDYKVGSTVHSSSGYTGIADTGTTLLLVSDTATDNYYAQVSSAAYSSTQGGYIFDCTEDLPTFSVKVGSTYALIPASVLNFGAVSSTGVKCFGSLQSVGSGTQNIYGDIFMSSQYAVFSLASGSPEFGFATIA